MERIEALGYIVKRESLATLKYKEPLPILVLEDMAPFSGYYDMYGVPRADRDLIPRSIFLVVKAFHEQNEDDFIRLTQRIKRLHPEYRFDAIFGQLTVMNEVSQCIRLKMPDLDLLPELVRLYREATVVFARARAVKEFTTIIKVRKFFILDTFADGILKDAEQANTYYLEMPRDPDWMDFGDIYQNIKNNYEFKSFDAAIGSMYRPCGLVDFIRIYSADISLEQLEYLKGKFRSEILRVVPE
ncbi:MAG TPA: hypothetical protein P5248_04630 [Bacteroidales bacterium]|nr:hypothetical protein [Bacteroidales bacterium]